MAPFPKVGERPPRDLGLGEIDRHHLDASRFDLTAVCPVARRHSASALIGVIMLCDTNIELPPPRVKLAK